MADGPRSPRSLSRRRFLSLTAAATAATASTVTGRRASAQGTPRPGGTLISAKTTEAPSLEPILEQALCRIRARPASSTTASSSGADGKLEPALAESWTTSADGKTWTFKLRRGVKFHNGREFVADDVKYTYERVLDPKVELGWPRLPERPSTPSRRRTSTRVRIAHQAAERVAAGRHGGRLVVDRPAEVVEEKGDLRRTAVGHRPVHPAGVGAPEPPQGAEESRLLGQGQAVRRRPRDQGHPGRGEHHRPAPHGQHPPRAARGQQELPPGQGRQAADRAPRARGSASTW